MARKLIFKLKYGLGEEKIPFSGAKGIFRFSKMKKEGSVILFGSKGELGEQFLTLLTKWWVPPSKIWYLSDTKGKYYPTMKLTLENVKSIWDFQDVECQMKIAQPIILFLAIEKYKILSSKLKLLLKKIIFNGRHLKIFSIFSFHDVYEGFTLPRDLRFHFQDIFHYDNPNINRMFNYEYYLFFWNPGFNGSSVKSKRTKIKGTNFYHVAV